MSGKNRPPSTFLGLGQGQVFAVSEREEKNPTRSNYRISCLVGGVEIGFMSWKVKCSWVWNNCLYKILLNPASSVKAR